MMSGWKLISVFFLVLPFTGCASLTDFQYEQTQRSRARTAWRDHGKGFSIAGYSKDYECGWKDGFYDVATGGKGCPPVVAPCKYWKPSQILEDCDRARNAYYNGFQDGVACALRYPQTHYLKLWTSCECPGPKCDKQCGPACGCYGSLEASIDMMVGGMGYSESELQPIESDGMIVVPRSDPASGLTDSSEVTGEAMSKADVKSKGNAESIPKGKAEKPVGSGTAKPKPPKAPKPNPESDETSSMPYEDDHTFQGIAGASEPNRFGSVWAAEPINLELGSTVGAAKNLSGSIDASYQMFIDESSVATVAALEPSKVARQGNVRR